MKMIHTYIIICLSIIFHFVKNEKYYFTSFSNLHNVSCFSLCIFNFQDTYLFFLCLLFFPVQSAHIVFVYKITPDQYFLFNIFFLHIIDHSNFLFHSFYFCFTLCFISFLPYEFSSIKLKQLICVNKCASSSVIFPQLVDILRLFALFSNCAYSISKYCF